VVIIDSMFYGNTLIYCIIHNFSKHRIDSMYPIVNIEWFWCIDVYQISLTALLQIEAKILPIFYFCDPHCRVMDPPLLQIETKVWPIYIFATHIAGLCISVSRRCQGWACVTVVLYDWSIWGEGDTQYWH